MKFPNLLEQVSKEICFIFKHINISLINICISKIVLFHKGIEDKLVATEGYGIVVRDEASAFLQDIKGQDNKNESNIGLMNQLFDGRGDKTSLAQL